ncbi:hypothetical protein HID58_021179 [Brassica napus]|uniref:Amino acid transporter transmembrane domain-containing protein n=1 Tax=Brassica napus TaxID=3708 RepID=A0ABQ8CVX0_BRANA|nr:hypothetical protein HID58_021179 [Brassica napus]
MKSLDTLHNPSAVESGNAAVKNVDDDGREKRTGTFLTASAHIITAVIGSGVLSLAWALAQLGWVAGTMILVIFAIITYYTSTLLADCYRAPDPITGTRNYTYMGVVRAYLERLGANCFHDKGHGAKCTASNYPYMVAFGGLQILLSQIPNFHKLSFLSIIAAVMSFSYASIGIGLAIAKVASGKVGKTTLTGTVIGVDVSASDKVWKAFQAVGDIAFSYAYTTILIEIQDTLRSSPPEKVMKKASLIGVSTTTVSTSYVVALGAYQAGVEDKLCDFDNIYCNDIPLLQLHLGLLGALAFWPLTVYFPVAMHIAQTKVKKYSGRWLALNLLVLVCLIVSALAAVGSIVGLINNVKKYKPFESID